MGKKAPIDLDNRIHLIDGFDLGLPGRTGTYVLQEEQLTLVETGPSPSVPHVLEGLKDLNLDPADVKYIILTHIHLDHAGGAGLLLNECPQAQVIVHRRGSRHLADPSRLITGARAVYGESFNDLFDPILPIPEDRLLIKEDGDTLKIGADCTLRFFDTPGHAKHHLGIYDPVSNGIFTGDTIGIRYHQTEDHGLTFYLPSTSPNQFDPEAMQQSMDRIKDMKVDRIYFGHFGESKEPEKVFMQVSEWIPVFVEAAEESSKNGNGMEGTQLRLLEKVSGYLKEQGIPDDHPVYEVLKLDFEVCAMGLMDYLSKNK
ncbi:MBL fold metallo-hydrolase [Halobacillus amylolyticus]|uniref:MBL fold metallo-hydrolase n=1 Tax=Halobacillus amylolyticus TaxID=2932259 RepID=A0ABY4H6Y5_9BACI|nr:MBL fold metallo-hydrolase [Halobacillus amylolyticus]UOR10537.1 MBL fold metallo-hydrolase [Halobacillus amylolyticus]